MYTTTRASTRRRRRRSARRWRSGSRYKVPQLEHPDVASLYSTLGCVYRRQGELEEALGASGKALEIGPKVLGLEHPNVAFSYLNLGKIYHF